MDSLDTFNRHYFHLLLSELLYKNDYAQTNRADLLRAVDYYDSLVYVGGKRVHPDLVFLDARAHYIDGVGYYESDSVVPACEQYLKALEVMEDHFGKNELVGEKAWFMGLNCNRLAELFSNQFMSEPSIHCSEKALAYNRIEPYTPYSVSKCYYHIGIQFDKMELTDSSFYYYNKALEALPDTMSVVYRDILTNKYYCDYLLSHDFEIVCCGMKSLLLQSDDSAESITRYLTLGAVCYEEGAYDSAIVYLEEVYNNSKKQLHQIQAADYLKEIFKSYDNEAKVREYASFLSQYAVLGYGEKIEQSQLAELFQNHQLRKMELIDKRGAGLKRKYNLLVLFIALFVVSIIVFVFKASWNQRFRKTKKLFDEAVNRLMKSNEHLQEENLRLSKTEEKEKDFVKSPPIKGKNRDYTKLTHEEIYIDLKRRLNNVDIITTNKPQVYANLALKKKEKHLLFKAVDNCCPDYTRLLLNAHPTLTASDLEICRFYLFGMTDRQIAVLLQKNYSTIWRRSNKLKTKLGCSDLQNHLISILFENQNAYL